MKSFSEFVLKWLNLRKLLLFPKNPSIFIDQTFSPKIWSNLNCLSHNIDYKNVKSLFHPRQLPRYDIIIVNLTNKDDKGVLGNLINRCAIYSSFIFIYGSNIEEINNILPLTLKDLIKINEDNSFIYIEPALFFVSKMAAYSYFSEEPYKELIPCIIPQEDLDNMVFCKEANEIANNKMVVGIIKDNLDKIEKEGKYIDKDFNFCIVGIPSKDIKGLSLKNQFDAGAIVNILSKKEYDTLENWGAYNCLPTNLIKYLHVLLRHSAKEILRILEISKDKDKDKESLYSRDIYNSKYSLFSITVGQYIPSQKGCCTFACYYLDKIDAPITHIQNTVIALYAQLSSFILEDARKRYLSKSIQSAVVSIMSRNGSHNIGSHVLSALSHNVGTLPDDRVLYQYIQHRMDYIATVTGELPKWTQPTMIVGEMMKTFLSQRHLLNYITGSEGLKGWQFQNDNLGVEGKKNQTGCLKFHVRRTDIQKEGKPLDFIVYSSGDSDVFLEDDLALAVPGGIVGQHAFFTIIENIIRNAAKHDWSNPPSSTRKLKYDGNTICGNLDVFIDLRDKPEDGVVEILIYTLMSDVFDEIEISEQLADTIKSAPDIIEALSTKKLDDNHKLPLYDRQRLALAQSFIDEEGNLRRENWGLAEMKISAGYLQKRDIADIGGLNIDNSNQESQIIISPIAKKDEGGLKREYSYLNNKKIMQTFSSPVYHLAYKFNVPKPKTVLLVSDSNSLPADWMNVKDFYKRYGIYACTKSEIENGDGLDYRYIILDSFDSDKQNKKWRTPFRIICMEPTQLEEFKLIIPTWSTTEKGFKDCKKVDCILKILCSDKENNAQSLLNDLAAQWSLYMQSRRFSEILDGRYNRPNKNLLLQIDTKSNDSKKEKSNQNQQQANNDDHTANECNINKDKHSGKSIISNAEVVKYVIEECFDTVIDTFRKLHEKESDKDKLFEILDELKADKFKNGRTVDENLHKQTGDYDSLIYNQLWQWVKSRLEADDAVDVLKSDYDLLSNYLRIKADYKGTDDIGSLSFTEASKKCIEQGLSKEETTKWMQKWAELYQNHTNIRIYSNHQIDEFVQYLCTVCEQTKVYLSKYSEKICTLPKGFSKDTDIEVGDWHWNEGNVIVWKGVDDSAVIEERLGSEIKNLCAIKYKRHFEPSEGLSACVNTNNGDIPKFCFDPYRYGESYIEPLSGTQSYLISIDQINESDKLMMSRLVENAMLRILIIDERVAKFAREHNKIVSAVYSVLGITVADDKYLEIKLDEIDKAVKDGCDLDDICKIEFTPLRKKTRGDKVLMDENSFLPTGLFKANARNVHELRTKIKESIKSSDCEHNEQLSKFVDDLKCRFDHTWDVLIIHQGIIDKWFLDLARNSESMEKVLESLRRIFPYVVITTGRGTPANIPSSARILPFSTLETTLFKKYPEKLILVDAIMNILPKGEKK